jgi:plastocyanin
VTRHRRRWPAGLCLAAAALVLVAGCGSGAPSTPSATSAASATATPSDEGGVQVFHVRGLTSDQFVPSTLLAHAGTVRIVLSVDKGSAPHTMQIAGLPDAGIPLVTPGSSASRTFTVVAGRTYALSCNIHPGMSGSLIVR